MTDYIIDSSDAATDFLDYVKSMPSIVPNVEGNNITFNGDKFEVEMKYRYVLRRLRNARSGISKDSDKPSVSNGSSAVDSVSSLIFGKDKTENIVAAEVVGEEILLFKADGTV